MLFFIEAQLQIILIIIIIKLYHKSSYESIVFSNVTIYNFPPDIRNQKKNEKVLL